MRTPMQQWPALVVTSAPEAGRSLTIGRGPVNAGSGSMNVGGGSQTVAGGDVHIGHRVGADPGVADAVAGMRRALDDLRLTASRRRSVEAGLDAIEQAGSREEAVGCLEQVVVGVQRAGALASAGAGFVEAVRVTATALGPIARTVLSLL